MKLKSHRLFIGKIPPGTSEQELRKEFSAYGNIESLEIKTKTNPLNDSVEIFGFVTLQTEDFLVPQCIEEFQRQPYKGVYLNVSRAKESFLDKLKREREEAEAQKNNNHSLLDPYKKPPVEEQRVKETVAPLPTLPTLRKGKDSSSSESSESESDEEPAPKERKLFDGPRASRPQPSNVQDEIVKKWNQETYIEHGKLKIVPITGQIAEVIDRSKPHQKRSVDKKLGETARIADEKRKQGLSNLKSAYEQQKLAIKSALAGVAQNRANKITFDDDDAPGQTKLSLFDAEDEEDDGFQANFSVRKQLLGEEGQKLYELQTSYQADNRFRLDARFLEEGDKPAAPKAKGKEAKERMKQLEILSTVTGKPISVENRTEMKPDVQMQRFDPLQKKTSDQIETPEPSAKEHERKKAERREDDYKVSGEKFFKVADNFTVSSQRQSQGFSLLSMFGKATETNESAMEVDRMQDATPLKSEVRFRHESSDSEEDQDTLTKGSRKQSKKEEKKQKQKSKEESNKGVQGIKTNGKKQTGPGYYTKQGIWKESFFFIPNDPRLDVLFVTNGFAAADSNDCELPPGLREEIAQYQPVVDSIFHHIVSGEYAGKTWQSLLEFTDRFGPRLTGTKQLEDAIDFAVQEMIDEGLDNVHTEEAIVSNWQRGSCRTVRYRLGTTSFMMPSMSSQGHTPLGYLSRNTIGELEGHTFKNTSVVVVSGHMDSWDVGTGASDDAGGVFISWKAVSFLKAMGLRPRRTIRAIYWTAEEVGVEGANAYERQHAEGEEQEFNVFFESDSGTFEPTGLDFSGNSDAQCIFAEIAKYA
uniref:RRM domain-containing protein n=1 Tax=Anopheles stephensi TaxID=30069 RepID=A0A182YQ14_ANOST